jgi:prepilin-type N-terminal cleavage/methylation domain-containing protein
MIQYIAKSIKRAGRDEKGFTLVELMAVLAVLAIIAAIAVPRFTATIEAAEKKADDATEELLQRAVDQYMIDNDGDVPLTTDIEDDYIKGDWPTPEQGGEFKIDPDTGEVSRDSD